MAEIWAIAVMTFATLLGAVGAFLIKKGGEKIKFNLIMLLKNHNLMGGILVYAFSPIFTILAFKGGELTVLLPLTAFTYIWSSLIAREFLKEKMNIYKWSGIALIIIGAAIIVR